MIPKLSAPLTKLIRTTEGVVWVGANIALVVAPIVSSHLSAADSIVWGSIMNSVVIVSRQALKAVAVGQGLGLPGPTQLLSAANLAKVEGVTGAVAGDVASDVSKGVTVDEVLAQIAAAEQAAAALQAQPGTPAANVTSGLAPEQPPAAPTPPAAQ